jgi:hypothetical protein
VEGKAIRFLPAIRDKRKETRIPSNHKELRDFLDARVELYIEVASQPHNGETVSDPFKGSAAKKINMFLRIIKVAD